MSNNFIGSKIAIVTKSQSRYSGTIIGIDAQASSIVLGNVKCYGTENRLGSISNSQLSGTLVPIMQFNNSDIEDLKIVDEENVIETSQAKPASSTATSSTSITTTATTTTTTTTTTTPTVVAVEKSSSIHDDPAIVSAVISSSTKDNSTSSVTNRFIQGLNSLSLHDESSKILPKKEGEVGGSWPLLSSSTWTNGNNLIPTEGTNSKTKSKFFDNFSLNSTSDGLQSTNRPQRWGSSNSHATQTSNRSNQNGDEKNLPARQPFFSDDQPFVPQQRNFNQHRRPTGNRRRIFNGGNRETFYDNGHFYDDEFDFESNNRKFNKIHSEEKIKETFEMNHQNKFSIDDNEEIQPVYDKKKSFFDNITLQETSDLPVPIYHRSRNQDTFNNNHHNDRYQQRPKFRANGNGPSTQRRSNYNNSQNGYHYRY